MTKKTYRGSCQCGRVQFEVELDLSQGTAKCNCKSCLMPPPGMEPTFADDTETRVRAQDDMKLVP